MIARIKTYLAVGLIISLLTNCGSPEQQSSRTVIKNVKGYTFYNDSLRSFSAMAFDGGKITEVQLDDSGQIDTTDAKVVNGQGKVVLPGLTDAHAHVMELGFREMDVNVAGLPTLDETLQRVKQFAGQHSDRSWIRGRGWNQTRWPSNAFPTAADLDEAVADRPVWLGRIDGHAGWANSKAMEMAGITKNSKSPTGGKIIRDENGNPTGVFIDAAQSLITAAIPARSAAQKDTAFSLALKQMRMNGITGVHDAGIDVDTWSRYKTFADENKLTTRIYAMIADAGAVFDTLAADGPVESYDNDVLALRSIKLYADGALGSRGAAMLEPYSDDPGNTGLLFLTQKQLNAKVIKAAGKGFQVNIHAIGDAANRQALNAFANANDSLGTQGLRHRIEHAQIVAAQDIPRFKTLNVIASMQPTHATSDKNMAEDRIGKQRMAGAYAWQTFMKQGTTVASGSDFPVEHVNPFFGLYAAISRQDHEGEPAGGWYPSQRMSRAEALKSFTLNAAYAAHQENELGSLEPGKWADFIMVDRDIFTVPVQQIWKTDVLQSWVAGEKVYQK